MAQALPLVYVIFEEWMWRRHVLAALDVADSDPADTVMRRSQIHAVGTLPRDRRAQRIALAAELGGEIIGGGWET